MLVALGLTVQANRRAADLTRMQADFISHVSHQLKTPLSLLSAATETVAMDRAKSPEKLAQYLGIMRGEVARLSALVQRILEYSRLQQQRGYEFERVDLAALVRETVAAFERSLASAAVHVRRRHRGARRPSSRADPAAIEQALVNLLDNAVKYSGPSQGGHRSRALAGRLGGDRSRRSRHRHRARPTAAGSSTSSIAGSGGLGPSRGLRPWPARSCRS